MKRVQLFTALFAFALVLSGCSSQKPTVNTKDLSEELLQGVSFHDELTQIDEKTTEKLYALQNAVSSYVYVSSGATAEEIAIFEFKDENDAEEAVKNAETRISDQKDSFEGYMPNEVKKLDNAIIKQSGDYLVVCVSDGDDAAKIIDKYVK